MPISDQMRLTSLTITPDAQWNVNCEVARFPAAWLQALSDAYRRRPEIRPHWSLPSRSLVELLISLDPAVVHVSSNLNSDQFIVALPGADTTVLAAAVASWATTEVAPSDDSDWWDICQASELVFRSETINLLECGIRPNSTAAPATQMFSLLASFLAQRVAAEKMPLLGRARNWILGPPQRDGRRSAVLWPPEKLDNPKTGDALVTAKVTFHVETTPNQPVPNIHADLSISRFPLMPVTYVPARGDGPPTATIWLHAPGGFLREHEPHTLLAATAWQTWSRTSRTRQWQWKPGLATALSRLTHLSFPAPEKVFADPAAAADEGKIRAYVLYSEGSKSLAGDIDDPDELAALVAGQEITRARSLLHSANTGFVPNDHIEVHEQLAAALGPLGISMLEACHRAGKRNQRKIKPRETSGQSYTLELWTQSDLTREAVLAALEHHHQLTPAADAHDPAIIHFTGDLALKVILKDVGALGAGLDRADGDARPESTILGAHANQVTRHIGQSPEPRAAIFELEDDRYFLRTRKIDPKPALKKAFARTDRRLQCLRPAKVFTPPATPPKNTRKPAAPYPGTRFTTSTIHRASAAINDALRQLGRLGTYETPEHLPDLEHIGIWLHHSGSTCIPIVIRLKPDSDATAYLASAGGTPLPPLHYSDLPRALASGKGRIPANSKQKAQVAQFLTNALGIGDAASQETHHRVVFVRSSSFRTWGWDWLQDKHIQPDQLNLPGVDLDESTELPPPLSPQDCPGLRIIRVRDRSSTGEVARGFAADHQTTSVRISGLFKSTGRIFYSINPRSDQMQTPLGATKLDPDILRNYTIQAANPNPIEIYPVFLQRGDDPVAYAALTSSLRRVYLHTEQATLFPAPLHLCELADEYL